MFLNENNICDRNLHLQCTDRFELKQSRWRKCPPTRNCSLVIKRLFAMKLDRQSLRNDHSRWHAPDYMIVRVGLFTMDRSQWIVRNGSFAMDCSLWIVRDGLFMIKQSMAIKQSFQWIQCFAMKWSFRWKRSFWWKQALAMKWELAMKQALAMKGLDNEICVAFVRLWSARGGH